MNANDQSADGTERSVCPKCDSGMWATWTDLDGESGDDKLCLQCGHREPYTDTKQTEGNNGH